MIKNVRKFIIYLLKTMSRMMIICSDLTIPLNFYNGPLLLLDTKRIGYLVLEEERRISFLDSLVEFQFT